MPKSLYTAKEIKEFKEKQIKEQKGIDPILQEPFPGGTICMDHDHTLQHCRGALHLQTNAFEGKVLNAYIRCLKWLTDKPLPVILRNLAEYLEQDYSKNPYHSGWMKAVSTKFNSLREQQKDRVLIILGGEAGKNAADRKKKFKDLINNRQFGYDLIQAIIKQESSQVKINEQEGNRNAVSKD